MQQFKSPGSAQRFLSIQAAVQNVFAVQRHLFPRRIYEQFSNNAFEIWQFCAVPASARWRRQFAPTYGLIVSMPVEHKQRVQVFGLEMSVPHRAFLVSVYWVSGTIHVQADDLRRALLCTALIQ